MLASVTLENFSLWIHVSAAVVGLGATFAGSVMFPLALQMDKRYLPFAHRLSLVLGRWFANPALLLLIITGIFQVAHSNGAFKMSEFWISATFAIVIIIGALNGAYFIPTDRRLGAQVAQEIAAAGSGEVQLSEDYRRKAQLEGVLGGVTGLLVLIALFLMVTKI